ncbi:DUF1835 domain-containing protein [Robiginitalea sp. M366]|uniref:DUF1835 domain-containing protein n=1 Tax=Robiginitalea aestuariiviva TaxID=3036903 RepID=UPI00240D04CA|nr:DUF1835 domain-containing protein [Robiginitalea aestuariiviva]MDG1572888.1 DUF1835 domain-containing protein [Robiginitalea aestuariiviva]
MSSQLHITNGDAFTQRLLKLKFKGDIITWREMLCEGKTETNVGSESFWKTRFEFLHKNYNVSKSWFIEKTLKEYRSLCNHKQQDEIILWFEYDLFCQINMLAVISWLKTHRRHARITLACSGHMAGSNKLHALADLSEEQLQELYKNRVALNQDDIEYADYVWQLYCSDNPIRLENLSDFENYHFPYLEPTIKAHLKRFPTIKNGLNEVENHILDLVANQKPKSKKALMGLLLEDQGWYGFGDSQYQRILQTLKPLFTGFSPARLSAKGKEILGNQTSYYSELRNNEAYLGGALKYNFLYNTEAGRILKL